MRTVEEIRGILENAINSRKINAVMDRDRVLFPTETISNSPLRTVFVIGLLLLIIYFKLGNRFSIPSYIPITGIVMVAIGAITFLTKDYSVYDFGRGKFYFIAMLKGIQLYKSSETDVREIVEMGTTTVFMSTKAQPYTRTITTPEGETITNEITPHFATGIIALLNSGKTAKITERTTDSISFFEDQRRLNLFSEILEIPVKPGDKTQMLKVVDVQGEHRKTFEIIKLTDDKATKLNMELNGKTTPKRVMVIIAIGILLISALILYTKYMR